HSHCAFSPPAINSRLHHSDQHRTRGARVRRVLVDVVEDEGARRVAIIAEEPIYEWEGVLVSTSRLAVRGRSYSIGGIGDVRVIEPRFRSVLTALCAGLSGVLAIS